MRLAEIPGRCIQRAHVFWPPSIAQPTFSIFRKRIQRRTIATVRRRGKYLIFDFCEGRHLLLHLRMSGRLRWSLSTVPREPHEHVLLDFGSHHLRLHDPRKFGRFSLVDDWEAALAHLGPEPLEPEFTVKTLSECLESRRRMLKPLLLDQTVIAGLGNIYVDESLWEARLHPCRTASTLSTDERQALHQAIREVLRRGLANRGSTLGSGRANFYSIDGVPGQHRHDLKVFRRTGHPCPRCHTSIKRLVIAQRSTHICPQCQLL